MHKIAYKKNNSGRQRGNIETKTIVSNKLKTYGLYMTKGGLLAAGFIWMVLIVIGNAYPQFTDTPALGQMKSSDINPGPQFFLFALGTGGTIPIPPTPPQPPAPNPLILASITPNSARPGGPGFILTASGSNFATNSVIQWNGSSRTTTYESAHQLLGVIPAVDIATAGTAGVTIHTPDVGTSSALTFEITNSPRAVISALSPSSALVQNPGFTLEVTGSNFTDGSVVLWDGSGRPTTFVDSGKLQGSLSAGDIADPKSVLIKVQAPGASVSYSHFFSVIAPIKEIQ
jgi:hypothetical protein